MTTSNIIPKAEDNISILKALEYLAYGWEPYADDDELIIDPSRLDKRKDGYFFTDENMIKATAILCNLIRNKKVTIDSKWISLMEDDFEFITKSSIYLKITNDMLYFDPLLDYKTVKKQQIKKVLIRYIEFEKDTYIPELLKFDTSSLVSTSNGKTYLPVVFFYTDKLLLIYADYKKCINFSKLKTWHRKEAQYKKEINKIINDNVYTTPYIQVINSMITTYGNKINKENKASVLNLIEEQEKSMGYNFTKRDRLCIFRVIRTPETKKGGAKPQGKTPVL